MNVDDALCTNAWRVNSLHQKGIRNLGQVISFTARQCIAILAATLKHLIKTQQAGTEPRKHLPMKGKQRDGDGYG